MSEIPTPAEIKAARTMAGLTQTQAAEKVYKTLRGWQKWESGAHEMDAAYWELFLIKIKQKLPNQ